jgi:H+/Cl- antiporter ClcA
MKILSDIWRRHLFFNHLLLLGGLSVGLIATVFAMACAHAELLFLTLTKAHPYLPLLITPFSFVLLYWLADKIFPGTSGSGIPHAIVALTSNTKQRNTLLSLRVLIGKLILTIGGFLSGASVGREGPTVLVGSTIMYLLTKINLNRFRLEQVKRSLIIAGGAAGIAAAFFTPLAGIVFAIEEHSKTYEVKLTKILITVIMLSGFICVFFFKNKQYFSDSQGQFITLIDWLSIPVCGILGGLIGGGFSRLLVTANQYIRQFQFRQRLIIAFIMGLLVVITALIAGGTTYGSSYSEANNLITHSSNIPVAFGLLKLFATLATYLSGICGGILAPTLATGAGIGSLVTYLFPHTSYSIIIILTMVSYFTGVVRSPITCFVIVLEMTGRYDMTIQLMAATILAEYTSSLITPKPLYEALAHTIKNSNSP